MTSAGSRRWRVALPAVLAAAGLLFATSAVTSDGRDLRPGDRQDLTQLIREEQRELEQQVRAVEALRSEIDAQVGAAAGDSQRVQQVHAVAEAFAGPAQLAPVSGPGVRVTLSDAPRDTLEEGSYAPDELVVHQQDVQAVVNAMWAGGAEAVQLMDQRIISTSAVRCVGNVLLLQGRQYSPPYVVTAVGDVEGIEASLAADARLGVFRHWVDVVGLGYEQERLDDADLPAFEGGIELRHAAVHRSDSGSPTPSGTASVGGLALPPRSSTP